MNGKGKNVFNLLGLAMRAGQIVSGEEPVLAAIRSNHAFLVILSTDASENTRKKIVDKCKSYRVEFVFFGSREELGQAIGKGERVILGITNQGFAAKIAEEIRAIRNGGD
ncbi:ribosomal protein L7Ae [[Clostridium] ultunense Esp]|uniref:L7Ae/L30e/S12e/Gadd45 family ribosomal protein n=1 Tax=Thermicanus aegyptius TaxID=94009 RepID=UPI0002B6FFDF|nr:ribosomal protein L7Ae [[Clostridium] ultunense Esp]